MKNPKNPASGGGPTTTAITLYDVLNVIERQEALSANRRRDLLSAVRRVASLLGADPGRIPLDLPALSVKLAAVNPIAAGLTFKTFSNIRSDFVAAVKASGLTPIHRSKKAPLNADWTRMMAQLSGQRAHIGLSSLARHASALGIAPEQVDEVVIEDFIAAVRDGSLYRKPNNLHRAVSLIWNEAARQPGLDLQQVIVPSFRRAPQRIEWTLLHNELRKNVEDYLTWCAASDTFAADVRSRALAPRTLQLRRDQIHASITALIKSGVEPAAITSLADLVSPENFKRILRWRHEIVGGRENGFNHDLAQVLVRIGREWLKVDAGILVELRQLAGKVPTPMSGLTDKNKRFLRQFDDPEVLRRLYNFPSRLWDEVKRDRKPNRRTLAKAQAALAVAILCYMPVRLQNLTALAFDVHLHLHDGARATSSLELAAGEVKNRREVAFDIPMHVAKMIMEYRDRIAPKIIGHRPERLFVNVDGAPKNQWAVAWLIRTYLRKRAGITISPHQFRHLSAKVVLDLEPGNFETTRQMLSHKSLKTTVDAYAGIDSRRAARHHQHLVEQALAAETPIHRSKKKAS